VLTHDCHSLQLRANFNLSYFAFFVRIKKRTWDDYVSGQTGADPEGGLLNDSLYSSTSFQLKFN
jgi:hypothetical protein